VILGIDCNIVDFNEKIDLLATVGVLSISLFCAGSDTLPIFRCWSIPLPEQCSCSCFGFSRAGRCVRTGLILLSSFLDVSICCLFGPLLVLGCFRFPQGCSQWPALRSVQSVLCPRREFAALNFSLLSRSSTADFFVLPVLPRSRAQVRSSSRAGCRWDLLAVFHAGIAQQCFFAPYVLWSVSPSARLGFCLHITPGISSFSCSPPVLDVRPRARDFLVAVVPVSVPLRFSTSTVVLSFSIVVNRWEKPI
jgi:hypothetical protein